ncbi:MAG: hypothetical protein IT236_14800 [Bacteroidia bacterium]|nr:hypothetical protein [Bacteroidia bacterium]
MKKIITIVSTIAVAAVITSCSMTFPVSVSAAPIGNKVGISKTTVLFGAWQVNKNFGIAEAAHNGKIVGGVATVDMKVTNYILFQKKELIVTATN